MELGETVHFLESEVESGNQPFCNDANFRMNLGCSFLLNLMLRLWMRGGEAGTKGAHSSHRWLEPRIKQCLPCNCICNVCRERDNMRTLRSVREAPLHPPGKQHDNLV